MIPVLDFDMNTSMAHGCTWSGFVVECPSYAKHRLRLEWNCNKNKGRLSTSMNLEHFFPCWFWLFSFKLKGLAESDKMRANHKFFNRKTSILDSNKFLHSNSNFGSFWIIFHTPTFQRADGNFWPPRGIQPKQLSTMFWLRLAILWGQLNGGGLGIWRTWGIFGGGLFFIFGLGIFGKLQWQKPLEQWYQAGVKQCLQTLDFLEWNSNVLGPDILSVESKRYWVLESFLRDAVAAEACRLWAITGLWVWEAWFLYPLRMTGTGCLQKAPQNLLSI